MKIDWVDENDNSQIKTLDSLLSEVDYAYEESYPIIIDIENLVVNVYKLTVFENAIEYKGHYSYLKKGLLLELIIFLQSNKHQYKVKIQKFK